VNPLEAVEAALRSAGLLSGAGAERLAVAFSGGRDSTALLMLAVEVLGSARVLALHVDHGVRDGSRDEAEACATFAAQLGVGFGVTRLDRDELDAERRARGPEGALRYHRYRSLFGMCQREGIAWLATAHHADDAVETLLLGLLRGSGLAGLAGPRVKRMGPVQVIRPLLEVPGRALDATLAQRGAAAIEDESNRDLAFTRNRLRADVTPVLRELAGSYAPLQRSVAMLARDREALDGLVDLRLRDLGVEPDRDTLDLSRVPPSDPVVAYAIRRFLRHAQAGSAPTSPRGHPPSARLVDRLTAALAEPGRSRLIDAPGRRLRVEGRTIAIVDSAEPEAAAPALRLQLTIVDPSQVGDVTRPDRALFDADQVGDVDEIDLRLARPGDRFEPFGMTGSVRLLRWLAGQGIASSARRFVPVVVAGDEILWVVGLRRGARAPITSETKRCLQIEAVGADH